MKKIVVLFSFLLINLYAVDLDKLEISGEVTYEIEEVLTDGDTSDGTQEESAHDVDLDIKISYPFSDKTEFVVKLDDDSEKDENGTALDIKADQIYLTYKMKDMNAQFGLQEISGPFFYERNGDGLQFLTSFDTNVLALSYYINNTFSDADEVMQLSVMGEKSAINYTLWYSKLENSSETSTNYSADTMQVSLFKETENLKYGVNYTTLNSNGNSSRELSGDQSQTVFYFENDKDTLRYSVAYVITGKKGGNVALDEDTDSDANFSIDEVGANDVVDGDVYYFGITKVFDDTAVEFKYLVGKGDDTAEEMYLSYNVQLDKNFFCYLSGNMWEKADESDSQKVEVGFNISF